MRKTLFWLAACAVVLWMAVLAVRVLESRMRHEHLGGSTAEVQTAPVVALPSVPAPPPLMEDQAAAPSNSAVASEPLATKFDVPSAATPTMPPPAGSVSEVIAVEPGAWQAAESLPPIPSSGAPPREAPPPPILPPPPPTRGSPLSPSETAADPRAEPEASAPSTTAVTGQASAQPVNPPPPLGPTRSPAYAPPPSAGDPLVPSPAQAPDAPPIPPVPALSVSSVEPPVAVASPASVPISDRKAAAFPWTFQVSVVDGRTQLEARIGKDLQFLVACDNLDMQTPIGQVRATGNVTITGPNVAAACSKLALTWDDERLFVEGNVSLKCKQDGRDVDLASEKLSLRLAIVETVPPPALAE